MDNFIKGILKTILNSGPFQKTLFRSVCSSLNKILDNHQSKEFFKNTIKIKIDDLFKDVATKIKANELIPMVTTNITEQQIINFINILLENEKIKNALTHLNTKSVELEKTPPPLPPPTENKGPTENTGGSKKTIKRKHLKKHLKTQKKCHKNHNKQHKK
jgi:2-hydroxy-3-keto-5-methylthiopentenyl-1-phosphate phosphatase